MASVTSRASVTSAPSPTPGKTKALLAWPIRWVRPATSTGANGLPEATSARPPVQARMSAGMASLWLVGLDSGSTSGRATAAAMASMIGRVKVPGSPAAGDADAGRPGPQDDDPLIAQGRAGDPPAGDDPGQRHRRRPLDVVVEAGQRLAVALEQHEGIRLLEVLPLQERPREPDPDRL